MWVVGFTPSVAPAVCLIGYCWSCITGLCMESRRIIRVLRSVDKIKKWSCSRVRDVVIKQTSWLVELPILHIDHHSHCIYRISRGECAWLRQNVPYVNVHRYNPKHLHPKLNGYGDNGKRKVWSSCGSTYCTCLAYCYPYTAHVRPSVSQPSQTHSAFIVNRCHSYSEL